MKVENHDTTKLGNQHENLLKREIQRMFLTLVLSEKKILNETKNHNPPTFKLNGRSLTVNANIK
jgi:hypothetical protein